MFSATVQLKTTNTSEEYETFIIFTFGFYHFCSLNRQKKTFTFANLCFCKQATKKTFVFLYLFLFLLKLNGYITFYATLSVWKVQAAVSTQRQVNKPTAVGLVRNNEIFVKSFLFFTPKHQVFYSLLFYFSVNRALS